jgi:ERCC4-type nuclease
MKIIIDNRERALIPIIKEAIKNKNLPFEVIVDKLELGDVIIRDIQDNDIIILERKQLADLASSIRDGRYNEQSYRLNGNSLHNHNIIYLIEGNLTNYSDRFSKVSANTLITSMFSLSYYKGFSVFRSLNIYESANYIILITDKIRREKEKQSFYSNNPQLLENKINNYSLQNYTDVVKKVKKDNITPDNIGTILLSQIPGVSTKTAETIMTNYDSLSKLIKEIENNNSCLDNIYYTTNTNQKRRISKTAINNILKYLINTHEATIKIAT